MAKQQQKSTAEGGVPVQVVRKPDLYESGVPVAVDSADVPEPSGAKSGQKAATKKES